VKFPPVRYTLPSSGVPILYVCTMATRAEMLTVAGAMTVDTGGDVAETIARDRMLVDAVASALVAVGDEALPDLVANRAEQIHATFPPSAVKEAFFAILNGAVDADFEKKSSQPSG
jgi:hypothetical protein